jgi:hypothetical protein
VAGPSEEGNLEALRAALVRVRGVGVVFEGKLVVLRQRVVQISDVQDSVVPSARVSTVEENLETRFHLSLG